MGCGCNKNPDPPKRPRKVDAIYESLHRGLVEFLVKSKCPYKEKTVKFVATLSKYAVPSRESNQSRLVSKRKPDDLVVWAMNKNYDKKLDPVSGWTRISRSDIISTEFIAPIKEV